MKGFIAAVVVIGVFCMFQVSANKMCYQCTDCDVVTDSTNTCNSTAYCSKVTTTSGDNTTVARSCTNTACKMVQCTTADNVETCCCDTEKCNGASSLSSALVMVIAPIVASIIFTRS